MGTRGTYWLHLCRLCFVIIRLLLQVYTYNHTSIIKDESATLLFLIIINASVPESADSAAKATKVLNYIVYISQHQVHPVFLNEIEHSLNCFKSIFV